MVNDEKLDKVLNIIVRLADVMETTLNEVKASNRSRWIVLLSMVSILAVFSSIGFVILNKMYVIMDQLEHTQVATATTSSRLDDLIDLAKTTASSPQIEQKLQRLQSRRAGSPQNLIKALSIYRPRLILEAAEQIKMSADSNSDGGTDGHQGY
jgi:hypothetical protein